MKTQNKINRIKKSGKATNSQVISLMHIRNMKSIKRQNKRGAILKGVFKLASYKYVKSYSFCSPVKLKSLN